ncbi:hypothetical protein BM527_16465 [Alteromonas sp. Mex14]|nr:hypothetical protein BM527_16465 [Alteromonas sp. Mex14]
MKLIFGCDPLIAPLTGIGRYTHEICSKLLDSERVEELRLFAHGKFFDNTLLEKSNSASENVSNSQSTSLLQHVRKVMANSSLMVKLYGTVEPILTKRVLSTYQDYIFHSPNFILPNFDGKKVVTIHDLSTLKYPQFHPKSRVDFINRAIAQSIDAADHIITDSTYIKNEIVENFTVSPSKITPIHLGVGSEYRPREKAVCQPLLEQYNLVYKRFLIFVSTIEPRKNVLNMLLAYGIYRQKHPHGLPLIIVGGEGWNSAAEHEKIQEFEAKGWVKYLGYVPQAIVPILVASAKGLLFVSLYEGFGLPVAEALSSSTAVLTSVDSPMQEFAGVDASYANPLCIDDIAEGIQLLCDSQNDEASQLGRRFDWNESVSELVEIYQQV